MPYMTGEEQDLWSKGYAFTQRWFPDCVWFNLKVPDIYLDQDSDCWPSYAILDARDQYNNPCEVRCLPKLMLARIDDLVESGLTPEEAGEQFKVELATAYNASVEALAYIYNDHGMLPYYWSSDPFRGEAPHHG